MLFISKIYKNFLMRCYNKKDNLIILQGFLLCFEFDSILLHFNSKLILPIGVSLPKWNLLSGKNNLSYFPNIKEHFRCNRISSYQKERLNRIVLLEFYIPRNNQAAQKLFSLLYSSMFSLMFYFGYFDLLSGCFFYTNVNIS